MFPVIQFANEPRTVPEDTSLTEAARKMQQWHVGALVVTRDEEPVGMVTDRDLMLCGILDASCETTVRECMSVPLVVVPDDATVHQAVETMRVHGVRRLGIRAADDTLVGVISADDVWNHLGVSMGRLSDAIRREFRVEEHPTASRQSFFGKE